jgi:hypothetical protein
MLHYSLQSDEEVEGALYQLKQLIRSDETYIEKYVNDLGGLQKLSEKQLLNVRIRQSKIQALKESHDFFKAYIYGQDAYIKELIAEKAQLRYTLLHDPMCATEARAEQKALLNPPKRISNCLQAWSISLSKSSL